VANLVVAEKSAGNPQRASVGNNDRAKHALSEAASSASPNYRLAENDARRHITQNRNMRDYDRDQDDLRNVIEDRRRLRARTLTPPRRSLAGDVTPTGRSDFRALAGPLKEVWWTDKFKADHIDRYDRSTNPEEFI
jgi:hypothetical protein